VVLSSNSLHYICAPGVKDNFNTISDKGITLTIEFWRADGRDPERPRRYLNRLVSPRWAKDVDSSLRTVESAKVEDVEQTPSGVEVVLEGGERFRESWWLALMKFGGTMIHPQGVTQR